MFLQKVLPHYFSWVSSIRMCVCVCVCVYHLFFVRLSGDGRLHCFHVLAIVNSAAVNIVMHVSF